MVELASVGIFAMSPWVDGVHGDGRDLTVRGCRHLGGLLARIHQELHCDGVASVLGPALESQLIAVTQAAKAKAKVDH